MKNFSIFNIPIIAQVILAMLLGAVQGLFMPSWFIRIFVTFTDSFGQFISFLMPLIILAMVAGSIANSQQNAGKMLTVTITLVVLSTFVSGLFSLGIGEWLLPFCVDTDNTALFQPQISSELTPYFSLQLPPPLDVMSALGLALMFGLGVRSVKANALKKGISEMQALVMLCIEKVLVPLLPLYIFGVYLKMSVTGGMLDLITNFAWVLLLTLGVLIMWVMILFFIASMVSKSNPFKMMWQMVPAAIMAFATSSSAATIPMTLKSTKDLVRNEDTVSFVIPLCANLHVPSVTMYFVMSALTVMMMVDRPIEMTLFIPYIQVLTFTCVAAPAIPGGVVAILPVLASILGFSQEMQAVCLSLGILLDAPLTAVNVVCDGAICVIVDKTVAKES